MFLFKWIMIKLFCLYVFFKFLVIFWVIVFWFKVWLMLCCWMFFNLEILVNGCSLFIIIGLIIKVGMWYFFVNLLVKIVFKFEVWVLKCFVCKFFSICWLIRYVLLGIGLSKLLCFIIVVNCMMLCVFKNFVIICFWNDVWLIIFLKGVNFWMLCLSVFFVK